MSVIRCGRCQARLRLGLPVSGALCLPCLRAWLEDRRAESREKVPA